MAGTRIDGHEAGGPLARVEPDDDLGAAGAKCAEAIVDPGAAGVEINRNAGRRPGRGPEIDQRRQIGLGEVA